MDARADGKTLIDMATEFGITTLDVVSQVLNLYTASMCQNVYLMLTPPPPQMI